MSKTERVLKFTLLATITLVAAIAITVVGQLALLDYVLNGQWLVLVILSPITLYLVGSFTQRRRT